jgi:SAM-dependent methyltransferase
MSYCPICKTNNPAPSIEKYQDGEQVYTLKQCQNCGLQYWLPFVNPGADWYEHDERYAGRNIDPILNPNWNHKKIISFLKNKIGKVLDIGCGVGTFLKHAQDNNWETHGLDFDKDAIKAAQETFDLKNLEVADISEYSRNNPDKKFDLITFFDVIEHVDNHLEFMSTVRNLLSSKGYIVMSLPYRNGATWLKPHDLPPRHLTRWDRQTMKNFLQKQGFKISYIARRSEGMGFIVNKLRFKWGKKLSFNMVGKYKNKVANTNTNNISVASTKNINKLLILARIKDYILFGLPALLIWLAMIPFEKRYITLYVIAQKNE